MAVGMQKKYTNALGCINTLSGYFSRARVSRHDVSLWACTYSYDVR